ncbi:MAG: hypothetical protein MI725_00555 [Pirellulales bacterium]|nr:hypothetical protein [Pirellulales bacterium]
MDSASALTLAWIAIHLVSLTAAWGVRMNSGSRFEVLTHACFFICLLAVSLTTLVGHVCRFEMWHLSAATLATMIVLAVVDFRLDRTAAVRFEI